MDKDTNIAHLRELVAEFVSERQWEKYHTPRNIAESVVIESGELLEIFQWGEEDGYDDDCRELIKDEVADVFIYLLSMCNALEIDISEATKSKLEKNKVKYPVERFLGRARDEKRF